MIQDLPWNRTEQGNTRRVGVEIELHGLTLPQLAEVTARELSLRIGHDSRYQYRLVGDDAGDWLIEIDFRLLKDMGRSDARLDGLAEDLRQSFETLLHRVSEPFVPLELVSPPIPLHRLHEFDGLTEALREAGATGSAGNPLHAFGLQFNPEMPATSADVILRYIQAYMCLSDWLVKRVDVDFTRRVSSYADPFPLGYVQKILQSDYRPELSELIRDYLAYNPSRNRSLDLMPLFLYLDASLVRSVTTDPLIKPRPAMHYRLPNSNIDQSDWSIARDWDDWCQVEFLAADEDRLRACCAAYLRHLESPMERLFSQWVEDVERTWLTPL